jgi:hypothetical protein
MTQFWTMNFAWWIAVVEIPAMTGLFLLIWRIKRELHETVDAVRWRLEDEQAEQRQQLAAYKVEVATTYASIPALRDTEGRLTSHLVRIEKKLDSLGFPAMGERE